MVNAIDDGRCVLFWYLLSVSPDFRVIQVFKVLRRFIQEATERFEGSHIAKWRSMFGVTAKGESLKKGMRLPLKCLIRLVSTSYNPSTTSKRLAFNLYRFGMIVLDFLVYLSRKLSVENNRNTSKKFSTFPPLVSCSGAIETTFRIITMIIQGDLV